ncbi:hypothetical protein [Hymenobacter nivis]|uniref:Uncharacterized protein n=1 Tax=Hymenobacter nivis TaxID=1850093 RepID=A0A2Z3GQG1_9BACT|nr:hypothetical protein [Hymenobacter nivis]AWM31624.1 hypothetical protein DDQ68_01755 [Hymenobacter nivis]
MSRRPTGPWPYLGRAWAPGRPEAPSAATLAVMRTADATMSPVERRAYAGPAPGAPHRPHLLPRPGLRGGLTTT